MALDQAAGVGGRFTARLQREQIVHTSSVLSRGPWRLGGRGCEFETRPVHANLTVLTEIPEHPSDLLVTTRSRSSINGPGNRPERRIGRACGAARSGLGIRSQRVLGQLGIGPAATEIALCRGRDSWRSPAGMLSLSPPDSVPADPRPQNVRT